MKLFCSISLHPVDCLILSYCRSHMLPLARYRDYNHSKLICNEVSLLLRETWYWALLACFWSWSVGALSHSSGVCLEIITFLIFVPSNWISSAFKTHCTVRYMSSPFLEFRASLIAWKWMHVRLQLSATRMPMKAFCIWMVRGLRAI